MVRHERASLYDEFPYPTSAHEHSHPDRLAVLAALHGLDAAPPATCRLLEVGCSDGGNLLPMALTMPDASFVGIDTSGDAIARARSVAADLGVDNARFEQIGLESFDPPTGSFDYVVAHGVFSWVPDAIRERLLALCAQALAPAGVAFVSYNAMPGARSPQTLRELLFLMLEGVTGHAERVAAARRLLGQLAGPDGTATQLGPVAAAALEYTDALIAHDTLSPDNTAFFVEEFVARAAEHGLQFLAEADFAEMQVTIVPLELQSEVLAHDDIVRREQLLDYMKLRRFRQTLLCHAGVPLQRELSLASIERLAASSPALVGVDDPAHPERVTFAVPGGTQLTTDHEVVVAAMRRITAAWPAAVHVADLLDDDAPPDARATLADALLRCYGGKLATLHVQPPPVSPDAGERPRASPLARLQFAAGAPRLTNLRHATVRLADERDRRLLALLDGTRDRAALRAELGGVDAQELDARLAQLVRAALLCA